MSYGAEVHDSGNIAYSAVITHVPTGIKGNVVLNILPDASGVYATESTRDSLFQAFLTQLAGMANVTISAGTKRGGYVTPVTP